MKGRPILDFFSWVGCGPALILIAAVITVGPHSAAADDLTGSSLLLCVPVQATVCVEDGECVVELPWNINVPQFIEVDLDAMSLRTTRASGENRMTPIEHLSRDGGTIVLHGFEMGRAFSWVISEASGHVTAAVATDGMAVSVFGACTPLTRDENGKGVTP